MRQYYDCASDKLKQLQNIRFHLPNAKTVVNKKRKKSGRHVLVIRIK